MVNSPTSPQVAAPEPEPGPPQSQARHGAEVWKALVKSLALLIALWFIGPVTLLIAGLIQARASKGIWDARERWTSMRVNAWLSLVWYLLGVLLHTQITTLWSHVPWLGAASIYPPILSNLLFRWVIALPLSPALACLLESLFPKTARQTERVLLPEEQAKLDKQRQRSKRKRQQAAPYAKQSGMATASPESPSLQQQTPLPAETRDPRTLWERLPENHPWKQAAIEEAARQGTTPPPPATHIIEHQVTPQPLSLPLPEEYNWDEGEGSLKLGGQ